MGSTIGINLLSILTSGKDELWAPWLNMKSVTAAMIIFE